MLGPRRAHLGFRWTFVKVWARIKFLPYKFSFLSIFILCYINNSKILGVLGKLKIINKSRTLKILAKLKMGGSFSIIYYSSIHKNPIFPPHFVIENIKCVYIRTKKKVNNIIMQDNIL